MNPTPYTPYSPDPKPSPSQAPFSDPGGDEMQTYSRILVGKYYPKPSPNPSPDPSPDPSPNPSPNPKPNVRLSL